LELSHFEHLSAITPAASQAGDDDVEMMVIQAISKPKRTTRQKPSSRGETKERAKRLRM
jgi:hypothetical protein